MADRFRVVAAQRCNVTRCSLTTVARRAGWSLLVAACVLPGLGCTESATAASTWFSTLPTAKQADILWKEDHETAIDGDAGSWDNGAGKPWASGDYEWGVTTTPAQVHSGDKALWSRINTANGQSGVRWPMRYLSPTWKSSGTLPDEAYYSGWIKFPAAFSSDWYMLMQWKTAGNEARNSQSDPIKSVNVHRSGNQVYLHLTDFVDAQGRYFEDGNTVANSPIPFPVNEWVHLEAYYKHATDKTGSLIVWQNGVEILRQSNTITQYSYTGTNYPRQWAINAYGDGLEPNPHTMYLDDAAISKTRLGAPTGSTSLPGDFDGNGRVDAADYTLWRSGLGGKYTQADYQTWKSNFGRSAGAAATAAAIPEPITLILLLSLLSLCPRPPRRLRPR